MNIRIYTALLLIGLSAFTANAESNQQHGISVTGKGAIAIKPDIFVFTVTLMNRAESSKQAKDVVDKQAKHLLEQAKEIGVDTGSVETAQINIRPIFERQHNKLESEKPVYVEVSRNLRFNLTSIEHYDAIIDLSLGLDVKNISTLRYETTNANLYYQQALDAAIKDAQNKAADIAKKLNVTLGEVSYFAETAHNVPRLMMSDSAELKSTSLQSNPGNQQITAEIKVIYLINH
ncbi:SIMPL domain-containing protein [Thalassotalea crassostreae]|uniref:SIMPL domain-containing protein n=1 Tax=Thalassotalea crassostreae TaxID=1763536 RepID=UPI0008388949|nr:SIMPL domain-containing protein [Thalassotalea crassostreae]